MSEYILFGFFILIMGACIGSFLNVVALRAISGESVILPSSKCPKCNNKIKWYDNIPVLSYLCTFRGKCRSCGEKVSIQYPLVEMLTAGLFLVIYMAFGLTLKTVLLLILISISIVICITDLKEENVYDTHSWILITAALIYSVYINDVYFAFIGFVAGAIIMEVVARLSYYLVRKNADTTEETSGNNINDYINKNKRAFGEGDTYLAAAAGALLGVKYFVIAAACAIIFQALFILPQFIMDLYKQKQIRLFVSILCFTLLSIFYFILSNFAEVNPYFALFLVVALIYFAIDSIWGLKKNVNKNGFKAIPFGPALLLSTFLMLFFSDYVVSFIKTYILMYLS